MKLDLVLTSTADTAPERARLLESLGVDGTFTYEDGHDLFMPLTAVASTTSLDLMTNIAVAFPRSPLVLATTANDLQLLSKGRFRLGLGTQVQAHVEKRFGANWGRPVAHMREWVEAIKAIFDSWNNGTRLNYRGDYTTHTLMTPAFSPGPNPYGPPKVLVGALGPRMNEMAAEVADGVLVMPFNTERHMNERTLPAIDRGLATAGRDPSEYEITVEIIAGIGRTDEELERARAIKFNIAFYASTPAYRSVLEAEGWEDLQPELNGLTKRGEWSTLGEMVSDEMMQTIGVWGTPQHCAAELVRRYSSRAQRVCVNFSGYQPSNELIAEFVEALAAANSASSGAATGEVQR